MRAGERLSAGRGGKAASGARVALASTVSTTSTNLSFCDGSSMSRTRMRSRNARIWRLLRASSRARMNWPVWGEADERAPWLASVRTEAPSAAATRRTVGVIPPPPRTAAAAGASGPELMARGVPRSRERSPPLPGWLRARRATALARPWRSVPVGGTPSGRLHCAGGGMQGDQPPYAHAHQRPLRRVAGSGKDGNRPLRGGLPGCAGAAQALQRANSPTAVAPARARTLGGVLLLHGPLHSAARRGRRVRGRGLRS